MRRVVAIVVLLLVGTSAHAAEYVGVDVLTVAISPQYPAPYQTVSITPGSTLIDLAASTITITVNGTQIASGSGKLTGTFTAGAAGSTDTVMVTAKTVNKTYTKTITLHPAGVALVTEPVSTTHPFYEGGSLVAPEGRIRFIAIPEFGQLNGTAISAENLVYTWKFGDQILEAASGMGKNILTATAPQQYRDADISLVVATQDGAQAARASTTVVPEDPLVYIYENDPLAGPWFTKALGANYDMERTESTFLAIPYFFAAKPDISWEVGDNESGTSANITLRTTGNGKGTAHVSVTASVPNSYDSASADSIIHFGSSDSGGFFGL